MHVHHLLQEERESILTSATEELNRSPLKHYRESDEKTNKDRLTRLFDITVECIRTKNLIPMAEFADKIANERYRQHFDLYEVHKAFNVLEEIIWEKITEKTDPTEYPRSFGLVSTVLGFGKESLAVTYLSLVSSKKKLKSLDLTELFKGI